MLRRARLVLVATAVLFGLLALVQPGASAATGDITIFTDPAGNVDRPTGITVGPDGSLWFTNADNDRIGRITTSGTITTFTDPGGNVDRPNGITVGPDGNLWFTNIGSDRIGRITPSGSIFTFVDETGELDEPHDITTGPDGNLWFTGLESDSLGRITPTGAMTIFDQPGNGVSSPDEIVTGPDGDLWFTNNGDKLGKIEVCSPGTFSDVSPTHPFRSEICWMGVEGISTGFDDGTYRPAAPVTRQAMSAFLYRLAGEPVFSAPGTPSFGDVGTSHPFYDEIEWMADADISTGYPATPNPTYRPNDPVTRQAMSAFIYRLADEPDVGVGPPTFTDVSATHPFFEEIEWMADKGITTGFDDGTYRPSIPVSRQAMSAFMQRTANAIF